MKSSYRLALVLLGTAALLAFVLWDLDLGVAAQALGTADVRFVVPALVAYTLAHVFRGFRLQALVGIPFSTARLFSINAIGYLAINVVPFRLGEMIRPYLMHKGDGVPFGRGMAAVFVERLLDTGALLVMLTGATMFVDLPAGGFEVSGVDVFQAAQRSAGLVVVLGSVGILGLVLGGERLIPDAVRWPKLARVGGFARRFREGVRELLVRPRLFLMLVLETAGVWVFVVGGVWCSLLAFDGVSHTLGGALFTWSATLASTAALPTPGFFGSYELGCGGALFLLGADLDLARIVAIAVHLLMFGYAVLTGLVFLVLEGLDLRELVSASRSVPE